MTKGLKGKHEPLTSVSTGLNVTAWSEGSISGDLVVAIEMTNAALQLPAIYSKDFNSFISVEIIFDLLSLIYGFADLL